MFVLAVASEFPREDEELRTLVLTPETFVLIDDVAWAIRRSVLAFTFV